MQDLPVFIDRHLNRGLAINREGTEAYYTVHYREEGPRVEHIDLNTGRTKKVFGGEYKPSTFVNPGLFGIDRYLIMQVQHGWGKNDLYIQDLQSSDPAKPMVQGVSATFHVAPAGNRHLIVRTTWKAPKGRVMVVDLSNPQIDHWKEIIPESADTLERAVVLNGEVFAQYLRNVSTEIRRFGLNGEPRGTVKLPGTGMAGMYGVPEGAAAFLEFKSYNSPAAIYTYDMVTGQMKLFFKPDISFDGCVARIVAIR
jgi:prolyl oligopeptidase